MTEKQGLRKIYDQFKFIAIQPLKINIALFIDIVLVFISIFILDCVANDILKGFFTFLLILNAVLIIGSFVFIANLQDKPQSMYDYKFEYHRSLNSTRELQKILAQNVDSSGFPSARKQSQINNNLVRYGSFVVSFYRYGYIFIRLPSKIDSRREKEFFNDVAEEICISLNMRRTAFQNLVIEEFFGLGQIKLKQYLAMRIIK